MISELSRIFDLPVRHYSGEPDWSGKLRTSDGEQSLRPIQNAALSAIEECKGALLPIGVGEGKSLISFLAGRVLGSRRILLLVPATLVRATYAKLSEALKHWRIPPIVVWSYSSLSVASGAHKLAELKPDLIVADEGHKLRHRTSTRTKRVFHYLTRNSDCNFVVMSGTLTGKTLLDYAHLADASLGSLSPLPQVQRLLQSWARVLDVNGQPNGSDLVDIAPLRKRYFPDDDFRRGARLAFQARLRSCPGVVCSKENAIGASLIIRPLAEIQVPPIVSDALAELKETGTRPDGEVFPDPLSQWRCSRELSLGFFYQWQWPNEVVDGEWLKARAEWNRRVRHRLDTGSRPGLDSPFLISTAIVQGRITTPSLVEAWQAWSKVKHRPVPPTVPIWLSTFALDALAPEDPCLIWYQSKAVEEALRGRGFEVYGAGEEPPTDGKRTLALSIKAHGTGRNLQAWAKNIILETYSSGAGTEQLLGRTHRQGQEADSVEFDIYCHTVPLERALLGALEDAKYIQDTTGAVQKLLIADYTS